jgi:DNA segregation ATPase FtsK/SpoIIIE, S-DNA-T family
MINLSKNKKTETNQTWIPKEIKGLFLLFISLLLFLSLVTFEQGFPGENWLGLVGYLCALGLLYSFGLSAYLLVFGLGVFGWKLLRNTLPNPLWIKCAAFATLIFCSSILLSMCAALLPFLENLCSSLLFSKTIVASSPFPFEVTHFYLGGVPFDYLYQGVPKASFLTLFSNIGVSIIFISFWVVSLLMLIEFQFSLSRYRELWEGIQDKFKASTIKPLKMIQKVKKESKKEVVTPKILEVIKPSVPEEKLSHILKPELSNIKKGAFFKGYTLPSTTLLTTAIKKNNQTLKEELRQQGSILEDTLLSFGIEAKVTDIHCGPSIASFELQPAVGVKVQKIKALENDIALNLQARSIRIIAPIPGKAVVGIEIPAPHTQEVGFKDMVIQYQKGKCHHHIPLLLGQLVCGDHVSCDLTKMPHCIIAGATGSGKSVCLNTMIISMIMNMRPDELRLLMIDPKKVELTPYSNIPHMLSPVITEANDACIALKWLVREMEIRYEIFKQLGVRHISAFNQRKRNVELEESMDIPIPEKMPFYVGIIDELADLMMVASQDIETPIARIAQMARAVGIHLILATQRPSREVITGLIKANFPTRIACKVASRVNSQIILDETGAESLLGNGDMLILLPGHSGLMRAQGAFIRDQDINKVIEYVSRQAPTNYEISSFSQMDNNDTGSPLNSSKQGSNSDSLFNDAKKLILETGNASTTFLQRKLKVGYARAASLMDELEAQGIVGAQEGSRPRKVLTNPEK